MRPTVCLVGEGLDFIRMNTPSGILTSYTNYSAILKKANCNVIFDPKKEYDILHIYQPLGLTSYFLALKAKENGKKVVISAHTTKEDFDHSFRFSHESCHVVGWLLKKIYATADLIIAPSSYSKSL
jgi:1,2-diacylglycerol-3-alpha-glucose alpha-1,2-glucosyltransferase